MKQHVIALLCGIAAGLLSIGLALLPNAFNSTGSGHFNENLRLTCFLGNALEGLLASALLLACWQRVRPSASVSRMLHGWAVTALLGVLIPSPGILSGSYADGLQ